jgi:hypothetical protein
MPLSAKLWISRWTAPIVASNLREKERIRRELGSIQGAMALLMKERNGLNWTPEDRDRLRSMLRSTAQVSPYLAVWVLPGSILVLPLLAWHLDARRGKRAATA